jgi:peroxiredoxin
MRLLTRGRLAVLVFVVAFLAINVVALRWSSNFFASKHTRSLLRYGDRLPKVKGKSLLGKETVELATKNPTNFILYFSSAQAPGFSTELVKYGEILSRRHKKDGLGITAIVQEDITDLKTLIDKSLVSYNVIVDEDQQIQEQLGLQLGESGVFVFDQQGLCRFSTRRPVTAEDLRQLVATEFLRVDPFEPSAQPQAILRQGKSLGSYPLLDARTLASTSIDQLRAGAAAPLHYVFFTAECSVCSLPRYLEEYEKFRRDQLKDGNHAVLIFDFNFSRTDVLQQLEAKHISSAAYIANEQLPELEYTGHDEQVEEKSVAVVETDTRRTVLNILPLKSYAAQQNSSAASVTKVASKPDTTSAVYEEMFPNIPFAAYDVATYQGKYFLTDFEGNRILVVKDNAEVEREVGRIGSGPGRLFHPGNVDVGRDGTIFVQDGGNERIVRLDQAGNYLGELRVADYQGLAVGAQNQLYLGQPQEGHLITVYSNSGKKLRSFGQLKKFSDVYGAAFSDKDDPYKIAFNRVRLSTDKEGNLYVSFMLTPLIQKYSPDGALLFERRLEAPEIDRLMEAIQKRKYISSMADGADARIVALDPVIDPANGNIMVPLVDGSIYLADREGNKLSLLRPSWTRQGDGAFYPFVAGLGAKGELLVTPFPPKQWYRLVMPTQPDSNTTTALSRQEATLAAR